MSYHYYLLLQKQSLYHQSQYGNSLICENFVFEQIQSSYIMRIIIRLRYM